MEVSGAIPATGAFRSLRARLRPGSIRQGGRVVELPGGLRAGAAYGPDAKALSITLEASDGEALDSVLLDRAELSFSEEGYDLRGRLAVTEHDAHVLIELLRA